MKRREAPVLTRAEDPATRLQVLVSEHLDFVWRSLRRFGVREADCDDGCQRVWLVVARRSGDITAGKERSFIFSVLLRVAHEMRRREHKYNHWNELAERELPFAAEDTLADPEQLYQHKQARDRLDRILSTMSWELRTVFIMFELEGFSSVAIARELGVPRGTVASRLRLAREAFQRGLGELCECEQPRPRASGE